MQHQPSCYSKYAFSNTATIRQQLTQYVAMATVQSDIFKPTKYGGKYTVTLIPGEDVLSYAILSVNSTK